MQASINDEKYAQRLLRSKGIALQSIKSFSFMKRHYAEDAKAKSAEKYGPGLLTLHLNDGTARVLCLHPSNHPSSMVRYLLAQGVSFDNYMPHKRSTTAIKQEEYRRPSLYMFYFFMLFITFSVVGYNSIVLDTWWGMVLGGAAWVGSMYLIYMLMTRFCFLKIDAVGLTIYGVGRETHYPYDQLRKVNFDFAREITFTHVMELLDEDYRYRLFYIGRVSRKKLNEIALQLQQAGVDATCSLNDNKRFYQDRRC